MSTAVRGRLAPAPAVVVVVVVVLVIVVVVVVVVVAAGGAVGSTGAEVASAFYLVGCLQRSSELTVEIEELQHGGCEPPQGEHWGLLEGGVLGQLLRLAVHHDGREVVFHRQRRGGRRRGRGDGQAEGQPGAHGQTGQLHQHQQACVGGGLFDHRGS